jgi:ABC-type multidrug transport system fused ATPase/permease subunit
LIRKKTLFIVTHRLSTIHECDRILLLNENRVVDSGTHQSFMTTNASYRRMVGFQQPELCKNAVLSN